MSVENVVPQKRRFKHQSYEAQTRSIHLPSPLTQNTVDREIPDDQSHFQNALDQWRQVNLAPAFLQYAKKVEPISASLALLLLNWETIVDLWLEALTDADNEAKEPLFDLLQKLLHDLKSTLLPRYESIIDALLLEAPKALPPSTLSTYLATLALLFKQTLIFKQELHQSTWIKLSSALKRCRPDRQRALAEVWGVVLRRLKIQQRREAVKLLVTSLDSLEDVVAWVFVLAFQSTLEALHTSTSSLVELILDLTETSDEFEALSRLWRRVLTATMYYCTVDTFKPIADIMVSRIAEIKGKDEESIRRTLKVVLVITAFRKGKKASSMISANQIVSILESLSNLPFKEGIRQDLIMVVVTCLNGAEMSLWIRGRRVLEKIWEDTLCGYWLAHSLLELDQSKGTNWKDFMLPYVQAHTVKSYNEHPSITLELLRLMASSGKLLDVDDAWKETMQGFCKQTLEQWELTESSVLQLRCILAVLPFMPELTPSVASVVEKVLDSDVNPLENFLSTPTNAAWSIAACLSALAKVKTWKGVDSWIRPLVEKFSWNYHALNGLVDISNRCTSPIPFMEAFEILKPAIMSHINALRLNALLFLASKAVDRDEMQDAALQACLQAEKVEISSSRTPERTLKTTKVGPLAPVGQSPGALELCIRWLVAQLKVNLLPLWKATIEALAVLANRCGEDLWPIIFSEIRAVFSPNRSQTPDPQWFSESPDQRWDISEHEKSWRNPGLRGTLQAFDAIKEEFQKGSLVKSQIIDQRFDEENYEKQLLKFLEICSDLAERHNRDLVPLFLSLASNDSPTRSSRHRLSWWLSMLAKFNNPKAVFSSASLHSIYVSFLSHPDRNLQLLAVNCLLTYKSRPLTAHEDSIRGLLDDKRWKDSLSTLDLDDTVQPSDRREYIDVLVRLIFGLIRERRGRNKLHDRRATLIGALRQCTDVELGTFVHLMLEPFGISEEMKIASVVVLQNLPPTVTYKHQVGYLVLLAEVMRILGSKLAMYWPSLLSPLLTITANAQQVLEGETAAEEDTIIEDNGSEDARSHHDVDEAILPHKVARNLRQLGVKRFSDFFSSHIQFYFNTYLSVAFTTFISPRLPNFPQENTQAPSPLLELFYIWSTHPTQITYLVDYDPTVLPKIYECLTGKNVKPSVTLRIFDIVENILSASADNPQLIVKLVQPHVLLLVQSLTKMVQDTTQAGSMASEIFQRQIRILRGISDHVSDHTQATLLIHLLIPLLRKSSQKVGENIKVDLLQVNNNLLPLLNPEDKKTKLLMTLVLEAVSRLLETLRSRHARLSAVEVFSTLASRDPTLVNLAALLTSLNSFDARRPEEPDFDRRMEAFSTLNEGLYLQLSPSQWLPILHNMLHFIHDQQELMIRSNAAFTLRRFITMLKQSPTTDLQKLFTKVLYPGIKNGLRSKSELIRSELLSVLANAVRECPDQSSLHDMGSLLARGDEEANFFNNISHVQIHRRTRALRRLIEQCDQGMLRSPTIFDVFVPLIGHYIGDPSLDHNLVTEAVNAMGHMARQLIWSRYYSLVLRYLRAVKEKGPGEKINIRALVSILDNFHFVIDDIAQHPNDDSQDGDDNDADEELNVQTSLAQSAKVADAVNNHLLPTLLQFVDKREETDDVLRIRVAVGVAKIALHLPESTQRPQITRLLTILSQALRSKSSETRDTTRDALCKIIFTAGPSYLMTLIKELRVALTRGPQLHVLAVTCHSIVAHITTPDALNNGFKVLDDIAAPVAELSAEVIFGQSGKVFQSEEFKSTTREVRGASSKALDSMSILAKFISPPSISRVLVPLRAIMHETESAKTMQVVDECLKRIASGLNGNSFLDEKSLLQLCHALISQNAKFLQENPKINRKGSRNKAFEVQTKRSLPQAAEHYIHNSYRFIAFGLDLLVVALRRNRFNFQDAETVSRLDPMFSLIGNTLYSTATPVVTLGLRVIANLVKAPLPSLSKSLPVILTQQVELIRRAGSTESEVAQAAMKSLGTVLRDSQVAQLKEKDLKYLLEIIEPDIEQPDRQAAIFALLRSIIHRKFVVPEIYDIMDKVMSIMVTNQSAQVQEACRGILLQFLLDYPQGKGRLRKQMSFLASNLGYVFESGRISVMELLSAIFSKFEPALLNEYVDLFFVALIMVLANDDSATCKERAATLIKMIYQVMGPASRRQSFEKLHIWAAQGTKPALMRIAALGYGLIIEAEPGDVQEHISIVIEDLNGIIELASRRLEEISGDDSDWMDVDLEWQAPYHALTVLSKLLRVSSAKDTRTGEGSESIAWDTVSDLMLFPHSWVRSASSRLLGVLYSGISNINGNNVAEIHPALELGMITIAQNSCLQLRSEHMDQALAVQVVKNLVFLGKAFCNQIGIDATVEDETSESNDEFEMGQQDSKAARISQAPLPWIFSKLSYQLRNAHLRRRNSSLVIKNWHLEPTAIVQWFAAMVSYMDADALGRYLVHILTPVYQLLNDDTVRDTDMDDIKAAAQELQDMIQTKVGTTTFTTVYSQIRQGNLAVRRERKAKMAILGASDPQAAAKRQIQRNVAKRESRKRKTHAFKERRAGQIKRRRVDRE